MASLLSWLGQKAKAVEAQVNPFDNGATYNTVVNNIPLARPQAPQLPQRPNFVNAPNLAPRPVNTANATPPPSPLDIAAGILRQLNPLDNNATYQQKTGTNNLSVGQQAVDIGKGIVHPFSTIGSAVLHTPQALYREAQNKPIYDIQQGVFGTTDPKSIGKQIVADTATIGLTAAAPGISRAAGGLVPESASAATRLAAGAATNEGVNTAFNVAGQVAGGQKVNVGQAAKQALGPSAFGVGVEAFPHVVNAAHNATPLNEVGAVGRDVNAPKNTTTIRTFDTHGNPTTQEIAAKPVQVTDGVNTVIHREPKYGKEWTISESSTGLKIANGRTQAEAAANAAEAIKAHPDIQNIISEAQKKFGVETAPTAAPVTPSLPAPSAPTAKPKVALRETPSLPTPSTLKTSPTPVDKSKVAGKGRGLTPETYAATFGVSKDQAAKDIAQMGKPQQPALPPKTTPLSPLEAAQKNQLNMPKVKENLPTNPQAPIKLPDVANATEAIRASESAASNLSQQAEVVANMQDKILGKDLKNRDKFVTAIEHPDQVDKIAKTFGADSKAFKDLVQRHRDLTNYEHAAQMGASNPRAYFGGEHGYISHDVVFNTPKDQAAYDALLTRTAKGRTALERTNPTLADLRANKLDIAPLSAGNATRKWASRQSTILRDAALQDRLRTLDPNLQVVQAPGENPRFVTANKDFNKQLKGVQPFTTPKTLKATNAVNTALKQVGLFGGGFHDVKTAIRQVTTDLVSGRNPVSRFFEGNKQLLSNEAHNQWNKARLDEGYGKMFADADVAKKNIASDLHSGVAKDLKRGSIEKLNPYMRRLFENKLDYFKKQLVIDEAKRKGITPKNYDPTNPAHLKVIQGAGEQAQNWFGGLNQRTLGKSPVTQQILKYLTLAPDFTEGKIRSVGNAFKGGEVGSLARRQVISEAIGVAILAEAGSKALTGKFQNPVQALISPTVSTNMKDKQGRPLAIGLPGSNVADIYRGVTDPGHFAQSHLAAVPAVVASAVSGKDYYGNDLVDPFQNPNPSFKDNLSASLKNRATIPGIQLSKTLAGKQSAAAGVINTLGGRVALDKNDPKYKETQTYFKTVDDNTSKLNPNEKAVWQSIHQQSKDRNGNYVTSPTVWDSTAKASDYLKNPNVLQTDININKQLSDAGQKVDPLWKQSKENITKYLQYQTMPPAGEDKQHWYTQNKDWYAPLADARSAFFDSLPPKDPNRPSLPPDLQYPNATPEVAAKQKEFFNLPSGSDKAQYIADNPDLQQQLDRQTSYYNNVRSARGYGALDTFPTASPEVQKTIAEYNSIPKGGGKKGGNLYRAQWIQAHPNDYAAMTQYFTQASLYGLQQSAGQAQFKDTGFDQKGLKDIYNLGQYDVQKNTDANGNTFYALGNANSSTSKFAYSPRGVKVKSPKMSTAGFKTAKIKAPKIPSFRVAKIKSPKTKLPKLA